LHIERDTERKPTSNYGDEDLRPDLPESRAHSQISHIVKSNGIPSPIKWHATTKRIMLKRGLLKSEASEYDPSSHDMSRKKRQGVSVDPFRRSKNPLDVKDIEGTRPEPETYIMKKQQFMNSFKGDSQSMVNSGRMSPLDINRTYDSKRYMRVDDIELKGRPGKIEIPSKLPEGFKEDTNMIEYKHLPTQLKITTQLGRLPFTRRYTKEKYGDDPASYSGPSILYHINQTDKDNDPDMCTRRFKSDVRRSEPNAYSEKAHSIRSGYSSHQLQPINQSQILNQILHSDNMKALPIAESEKAITKESRRNNLSQHSLNKGVDKQIDPMSRHSIAVKTRGSRKSNKLKLRSNHKNTNIISGEYYEEVTDEEEESEEED